MCSNCLKYNTEDTPFHSLALRMQKEIDRVFQVKRAVKFLRRENVEIGRINEMFERDRAEDSSAESDLDSNNDSNANSPRYKREWAPEKPSVMELTEPNPDHEEAVSHTDAMYEDDVLRFALRAAAEARARLTAKYPKRPRMGYLNINEQRTTYHTIKDGSGCEPLEVEVRPLKIEVNQTDANVEAIEYLTYGPYGSYAPTFDKRLNDLHETKEAKSKDQEKEERMERESLYKIYGGEKELYYVQSLQSFVSDMPQPVVEAVESILNRLTDGLHETSRLNRLPIRNVEVNPVELLSLRDSGVETGFLDAYHPESESLKTAEFIDDTLDEAAKLILKINGDLNVDLTEEEKQVFRRNNIQITQLNTLLKKMVPLYEKRGPKVAPTTTPVKPAVMMGGGGDKTPVTVIGSKVKVETKSEP